MFFSTTQLSPDQAKSLSPRMLAHLGDAVFHLYEREKQLEGADSVSELHKSSSKRTSGAVQADLLEKIVDRLTAEESDLVRRARNIKPPKQRRLQQATYRRATAFEALVGYLYLTDVERLKQVLVWTSADS